MNPGEVRRGPGAEMARLVRSNLSATAATCLDWVLMMGLAWAGSHYLHAAAAGAAAGSITDFSLKRHWAFDRRGKAAAHAEGLRYLAVSGASLAWNLVASWTLVHGLGLPPVLGVIAASIGVGLLWNYPLHRLYVFRETAAPAEGTRS